MKRFIAALTAVLAAACFTACGQEKQEKTEGSIANPNAAASQQDIPEDVKSKLTSALEIEPLKMAAEEWTAEKVKDTIYINGEKLSEPLTLRDLGGGIELVDDEILNYEKPSACISYYGIKFASFLGTEPCSSEEEMYDVPIRYFSHFVNDDVDTENTMYPVSVNGIYLGMPFEKAEERLSFAELSEIGSEEYGIRNYHYENDGLTVIVRFSADKVDEILLKFNSLKK